jgi:hypothetical protein
MTYMKMLGLVVLAGAKGVSPAGEKHLASMALETKSARSAKAKEAKCPS